MYFVPMTQRAPSDEIRLRRSVDVRRSDGIETARPMNDMETLARKTLAGINPNLTVVKFQTFDQQIADRFTTSGCLRG